MEVELLQKQKMIKQTETFLFLVFGDIQVFSFTVIEEHGKLFQRSTFYFLLASYVYTKAEEIFYIMYKFCHSF